MNPRTFSHRKSLLKLEVLRRPGAHGAQTRTQSLFMCFFGEDKIGIRLKCADSWEGTKESYLSLPGDENKWPSMKRQNSPTKIWLNKRLNLLLTVRYFCFHHVSTVSFLLSKTCPFVVSTVIHNYLVVIMLIPRPILLDRETVDNWCKIAINKQKKTIELLHNSA